MTIKVKLITLISFGLITGTIRGQEKINSELTGKWVRMSQTGPISLNFKQQGVAEVDFNDNQSVDVVSNYKINANTIEFSDQEGAMCQGSGSYKIEETDYYLSLDLIDDMCNGRTKMTMGFWTKPNFAGLLDDLTQNISTSSNTDLYLSRARIYLALGKSAEAKADLDFYLKVNPKDARALINRAGTKFPADMNGVIDDCNQAISLDPDNKNAYFLRGLARYELGQHENACNDFSRAVDLGFSILRVAEEYRCSEYWKEEKK